MHSPAPEFPIQSQHAYLTYDEKKAADAAFKGEPFNPSWSAAALTVYQGIRKVLDEKKGGTDATH